MDYLERVNRPPLTSATEFAAVVIEHCIRIPGLDVLPQTPRFELINTYVAALGKCVSAQGNRAVPSNIC